MKKIFHTRPQYLPHIDEENFLCPVTIKLINQIDDYNILSANEYRHLFLPGIGSKEISFPEDANDIPLVFAQKKGAAERTGILYVGCKDNGSWIWKDINIFKMTFLMDGRERPYGALSAVLNSLSTTKEILCFLAGKTLVVEKNTITTSKGESKRSIFMLKANAEI